MSRNTLRHFAFVLVLTALGLGNGWAKAPGEPADARLLAERAIVHLKKVGFEAALKDFSQDQNAWGIAARDKVVYVLVYGFDGTLLAHSLNGSLVGRNLLDVKDPAGAQPVREAIAAAKGGAGKIAFQWANPATKKIGNVQAFVIRVPGKDALVTALAFVD